MASAGQRYTYQVKARNGSTTSGFSNSVVATAPNCATASLYPPLFGFADPLCNGTTPGIELGWFPVSSATNYEVWRNGSLIFTTGTDTYFWDVLGLTAGQRYTYQVKAKNNSTTTGFSNSVAATAPNCPSASRATSTSR